MAPRTNFQNHISDDVFLTQGAFGEIRMRATLSTTNGTNHHKKQGIEFTVVKAIKNAFVVVSKDCADETVRRTVEDEEGEKLLASILSKASSAASNERKEFPYKLSRSVVREVTCLKYLTEIQTRNVNQSGLEPCIVPLLDVFLPAMQDTLSSPTLDLLLPYYSMDLAFLLEKIVRPNTNRAFPDGLEVPVIRRFAKDVVAAIEFCHSHKIMHRDVKPSNFLLSLSGVLQLTDFGLAKSFTSQYQGGGGDDAEEGEKNKQGEERSKQPQSSPSTNQPSRRPELEATNGICSLNYRPPEIMFGSTTYGPEIDVFGAGLVVAELYNLRPLLPGKNVLEQVSLQIGSLGTPPSLVFANGDTVSEKWPDYGKFLSFKETKAIPIASLVPRLYCDPSGQALIGGMLQMDPTVRLTAKTCLENPWFLLCPLPSRLEICKQFFNSYIGANVNEPTTQHRCGASSFYPVVDHGKPHSNDSSKEILDWTKPMMWQTQKIRDAWNPSDSEGAATSDKGMSVVKSGGSIKQNNIVGAYASSVKPSTGLLERLKGH